MKLLDHLLAALPDGEIIDVRIGLHWTAVVVESGGAIRCGLASTLSGGPEHRSAPDVPQAGNLATLSGRELASLAHLERPTLSSLGIAALNALLPRQPETWIDENAETILERQGHGKRVALVGSFPFVHRLRQQVGELLVLEQSPGPGELPSQAASEVLPDADVVAITGMTIVNHTLEELLHLCSPQAFVMVLGPSTPLSRLLFGYGIDLLSGSVVTAIEPVLRIITQGGSFRQMHHAGVRLVSISNPGSRLQT